MQSANISREATVGETISSSRILIPWHVCFSPNNVSINWLMNHVAELAETAFLKAKNKTRGLLQQQVSPYTPPHLNKLLPSVNPTSTDQRQVRGERIQSSSPLTLYFICLLISACENWFVFQHFVSLLPVLLLSHTLWVPHHLFLSSPHMTGSFCLRRLSGYCP